MRVRFLGEITREMDRADCKRSLSRAFHPKARSHDLITGPTIVTDAGGWRSPPGSFSIVHTISRAIGFAEVKEETAQRSGDT